MTETVTVVGAPRVVAGPEVIPRKDGKGEFSKWQVVLDNGSILVTYSPDVFNVVNARLDQELTFEAEDKNDGYSPKITKVMAGDEVLWEPKGGGGYGKREWVDTTPAQNARHALGSASATIGQLVAAGKLPGVVTVGDVLVAVNELALGYHQLIEEMSKGT